MNWDEVGTRIKQFRDEFGITSTRLGVLVGKQKENKKALPHNTILNWEKGSEIKHVNLSALIKAIGKVDPSKNEEWLLHGEASTTKNSVKEPNVEYMPKHTWEVPLIDSVAAGEWTEATDPYEMGHGEEMLPNTYNGSKNTFALKVKGESMLPEFPESLIIYIDPNQMPENGDFCVAKLDDSNEATFKQYVVEDGQKLLKALNPDWPNKYVAINGNCHIVGKMIGVYKKY